MQRQSTCGEIQSAFVAANKEGKSEPTEDTYENELEISAVTLFTPTDEVIRILGEPIERIRDIQPWCLKLKMIESLRSNIGLNRTEGAVIN
ncbi:MAG TPA: hypothetical protein DER58_12760 [Firmicutes bacterium]|jgi:hypothetical protein|nr:hypothetical protein [Bacillota bacterium]